MTQRQRVLRNAPRPRQLLPPEDCGSSGRREPKTTSSCYSPCALEHRTKLSRSSLERRAGRPSPGPKQDGRGRVRAAGPSPGRPCRSAGPLRAGVASQTQHWAEGVASRAVVFSFHRVPRKVTARNDPVLQRGSFLIQLPTGPVIFRKSVTSNSRPSLVQKSEFQTHPGPKPRVVRLRIPE